MSPDNRTGPRRGGGPFASAPAFSHGKEGAGSAGTDEIVSADDGTGAPVVHGRMRETRTTGGVRVLSETIPGVRSVAVGVWARQGSAHEPEVLTGASHLLEHMVFKGTARRSPREIALSLERLGGSLDAFTSREHTSYQARVLSEHLPEALDVLADLVLEPLLRTEDLALEREVVLEEIAMVEDVPDDLVFELHGAELWNGHPYGRSILGSRESVAGMEVEQLRALHRDRYLSGELIVAAAGQLEHDALVAMVEARFGEMGGGAASPVPEPSEDAGSRDVRVQRALGQTHIVMGCRTPGRGDPARFPLVLISAALGGGMSSRLFQRIREELALAYTVYSFQAFHSRAGTSGVYLGTRPASADRAITALREEYSRLAREGLSADELREVKDQVKGQVMLSLESTSARLYRLAGFALYDQPYLTLDGLLARIDGVTREQIADATGRYFDPDSQVVLRLGPEEGRG